MKGRNKHRLIGVWRGMHNRCSNPKIKSYLYYGAKGIKVCAQWSGTEGFDNFVRDMGEHQEGDTVERINSLGNYEPGNCRWATRQEQANNKSNNRPITANGETKTLAQWAKQLGCQGSAISHRLDKQGLSEQEAINKPIPKRPNSKLSDEQALTIRANYPLFTQKQLAVQFGVDSKTILNIVHGKIFKDLSGGAKIPTPKRRRLLDDQIREIRAMAGTYPQPKIAEMYGICRPLVSMIINKKRYADVI